MLAGFNFATCIVANSRLASEYVLQVLFPHPHLGAISLDRFVDKPAPVDMTVFVFDGASMLLPLGESLRRLFLRFGQAKYLLIDKARNKLEVSRLLSMGFHGFVEDFEVEDTLAEAVLALHLGELWIPQDALQECARRSSAMRPKLSEVEAITPREGQILELVQQRYSNKEIGIMLHIKECTTKFHLTNIFGKLQVVNRRELQNREVCGTWERI
jgi:DNA-binding NarL/FixJ family response regulator